MAAQVAGELYESITGQLFELGRQLRQPSGYPFSAEQLKDALQNAIEGKFGVASSPPKPTEFQVWKTVKLGAKKSPADYRKALKSQGVSIGTYADQILDKVTVAQVETEVDLVRVTGKQLGFTRATRRDVIYERAKSLGLKLCSAEVGPAIRLDYKDQPKGEWFLIGMEPLLGADGRPLFYVARDSGGAVWLSSDWGGPGYEWRPEDEWVFVRPRK
jgi:hypothetical protein